MKSMTTKDFIRFLSKNGYTFVRMGGRHHIYGNNITTVPVPAHHKVMAPGTIRDICKQLSLKYP